MKHLKETSYSGPLGDFHGCLCDGSSPDCPYTACTPPVHQRGADGLPPVESPGLGVCIPDRPDLDFYDVFNPIILGWVVDVTT
ncbi:hypothetical protein, partial [Polaromonas sp. YR568]|uniref:hypothetical protein n=1 Tax=Polaromonas sp. YR568 TaxID=1855301 RepID=UPI0031382B88